MFKIISLKKTKYSQKLGLHVIFSQAFTHFYDPLMEKAKQFLSLNVLGLLKCVHLSQNSITVEGGHSKTFILNFQKDPEASGT